MSTAHHHVLKIMNSESRQRINYLFSTIRNHAMLLIVPAIIGLVLATFYAFFVMPEMWTARQSFLIRDDLSGSAFKPGRFDSEEARKSAQETILEVARRPLVVRSVLEKLGPESMLSGGNWVTDEVIEDTQKAIDISAPNGAEFGKTDAIVLTAKSSTRERTRKFIELLSEEITTQTNRIRSLRFESMESESHQAYLAAVEARDDAINRLNDLDQRLGSDFGFLTLRGNQPGQSNQPSGVEAIQSEILRKQDELEQAETVFAALLKAFENPKQASQLPSEVAAAQPKIENTMAKLLDLQEELHLAKGLYSNRHPRVRSLAKAIEFSQQQLYNSLTGEMAGVQAGIQLKKRQLAGLKDSIEKLKARLIRLSKARSEHLALTTQSQQLGEAATRAKTAWTEIESRTKTARTVGLLTPTDVAQVSTRPDGVGKKAVALAGLLGGLMIGTGLMFIVAPPMVEPTGDLATAAPQPTRATSATPQQFPTPTGVFATAGNSISSASFQQAASAMQSAANAMQLAASSETAVEPPATPPSQPSPTVRRTPQPSPTAQPKAVAPQTQVPAQPANPTKSSQQPTAKATPQPTAEATPAALPPNVRPVDLAKSASENNEFVRVSNETATPPTETDTPPRAQTDSNVSKSARAIADSVSLSGASTPQRSPMSTTMLSEDEKTKAMTEGKTRTPVPTDPFIVTADGQTSQNPNTSEQDINDAIPEQIRKLSESIMKFGKDKK